MNKAKIVFEKQGFVTVNKRLISEQFPFDKEAGLGIKPLLKALGNFAKSKVKGTTAKILSKEQALTKNLQSAGKNVNTSIKKKIQTTTNKINTKANGPGNAMVKYRGNIPPIPKPSPTGTINPKTTKTTQALTTRPVSTGAKGTTTAKAEQTYKNMAEEYYRKGKKFVGDHPVGTILGAGALGYTLGN